MSEERKSKLPLIIVILVLLVLLIPLKDQLLSIFSGPAVVPGGISIGNSLIEVSLILGILSIAAILMLERRGDERALRFLPWAMRGAAVLLVGAFALLTYYFVKSDFSILYVWQFSSKSLPLMYKISAVWAGQDGTFLLWAMCIFLYVWWISEKNGWNSSFVRKTQFVNILIGIFFLALTLMVSPFRTLYEVYSDLTPDFVATIDGNGLNPLLQDPWMAIHPPIVFVAYAAVTIPLAAILVYLLTGDKEWASFTKYWNRFSWLFLTLGIAIGGYWAYKVLGWGGYWAWDPVETSSFVPWLTLSGFMHTSVQYRRKGTFKLFSPFLAITTFLLVIYATFITRSGLWESVHAFAETTTGPWLAFAIVNMAFCSVVLGIDFYLREKSGAIQASAASKNLIYAFFASQFFFIIYKTFLEKGKGALPSFNQALGILVITGAIFTALWLAGRKQTIKEQETPDRKIEEAEEKPAENKKIEDGGVEVAEKEEVELITRDSLFYLAAVLFSILAFVSFWGITYPMLVQAQSGVKVSVGVDFFNKWSHPFTVFLALLMGFCLMFGRLRKDILLDITGLVVIATVASLIIKPTKNFFIDSIGPILTFGSISAIYKISESALSEAKPRIKARSVGTYIIHLGFALILIGTVFSAVYNMETSATFNYPSEKGVLKQLGRGYELKLEGLDVWQTVDGWWATDVVLEVYQNGKFIGRGKAGSIDDKKNGRVTHVYICRELISDIYIIFQGTGSQSAEGIIVPLTIKLVPAVNILWYGVILLAIGILPLLFLDVEAKLPKPPAEAVSAVKESPEEKKRREEREFLKKSLTELEASYRAGKISKNAYEKLKSQYEVSLKE